MASNQTTNYPLNQWESTDQVLRTDFNADNAKLDAVLAGLAEDVSGKAGQTALDALSSTVAGHTAAMSGFGNCRIVYGSYTGSGPGGSSNPSSLTFDGKPLAVFIMAQTHSSNTWSAFLPMIRGAQWASANTPCTVTWSENGVSWYHNEGSAFYQLSRGTNFYIALLAADE